LDPVGDPTARKFKRPNLLAEVHKNRVAILSDIFTIVAAFEAAEATVTVDPLVGYDDWCRWVQQPLVWLGQEDPVVSVRELQTEDEDRANLERVVELWFAVFGSDWVGVKTLCTFDAAKPDRASLTELIEVFRGVVGTDREGKPDAKGMGYWLRKNKDRWTRSGMRIERKPASERSNRSALWKVAGRRGSRGSEGIPAPSFAQIGKLESGTDEKSPSIPPIPSAPTEGDDM
jgi:hypothetical protein